MTETEHYQALCNMYLAAPINEIFKPRIAISQGAAEIEIMASEKLHHPAGGVHGSVYFKMLDDAAFFAANSLEPEVFVLTTVFTTYLTRPVSTGLLRSVGKVVNRNRSQCIAEAVLYDSRNREIARGNGVFVPGKLLLKDISSYAP